MRDRNPHVFRALPFLLAVSSAAPVLAQAPAPAKPAKAPAAAEAAPIEEFDLQSSIVSSSGGLTADQVAAKTVARSPQLQSARAQEQATRFQADEAWANFLPRLTLAAQYKRISEVINNFAIGGNPQAEMDLAASIARIQDPAAQESFVNLLRTFDTGDTNFTQPLNNYALSANLVIPVSDILIRVLPAYEGAKGFAEAQKLQTQATEEGVELAAREAFYGYAAIVARRNLLEQTLKQSEAVAAQTKLFVDAGTKAPVELLVATSDVERARAELATADGDLAYARVVLATMMGVDVSTVQGIGEPITELPEMPAGTADDMTRRALEQRTELLALRKAVGANERLQSAENNAKWPSLSLEGTNLYANPNPRYVPPEEEFNNTWEVAVNLTWSPNQVITARARNAKAGADAAKARADLQYMEDNVRTEVTQAYEKFKSAIASAKAAEASVAAAEEAYRVRLATYKVGAGVLIDLTDAQKKLNDARLAYVSAVIQARLELARLKRRAALDV